MQFSIKSSKVFSYEKIQKDRFRSNILVFMEKINFFIEFKLRGVYDQTNIYEVYNTLGFFI